MTAPHRTYVTTLDAIGYTGVIQHVTLTADSRARLVTEYARNPLTGALRREYRTRFPRLLAWRMGRTLRRSGYAREVTA